MYRSVVLLALILTGVGLLSGQTISPATTIKPQLVLDRDGHTNIVKDLFFTPNGEQVVTVSLDKTVRVWEVESGNNIKTFRFPSGPDPEGRLLAAALSADGRSLAVAGVPLGLGKTGGYIYVVWLQTGQLSRVIKLQDQPVVVNPFIKPKATEPKVAPASPADKVFTALAFSKDGAKIAAGSADKTTRIIEVKSSKVLQTLKGHTGMVHSVSFSPDGQKLVTTGDSTGRIWTVSTGRSEATLNGGKGNMLSGAWSPDGKTVATGNSDGTITLFEPNGKPRQTIAELGCSMTSLTFTPEGKEIVFTGGRPLLPPPAAGAAPAAPPAGGQFAARVLDLATGKEKLQFNGHNDVVTAGTVSRDGTLAVTVGGKHNEAHVWKIADGSNVKTLGAKGQSPEAVAWTADGKGFVVGPTMDSLSKHKVFNLEELSFADETKSIHGPQASQENWSIEKDAKGKLIVKEKDKVVHTIDLGVPGEQINSFTWVRNGRAIVAGRTSMYLIDPKANRVVSRFAGHPRQNYAVAATPDGRLFISVGGDHIIRVWDPDRDEPMLFFYFAESEWIAWTQDGYYAASVDGERMLGWLTTTGADKLPTYAPASRFRQALSMPEVIKLIVPAGSVAKALQQAGKKPSTLATVTSALPPQVAITGPVPPEDGGVIKVEENTKVEIQATAKSLSGQTIKAMRLLVDGRPYGGLSGIQQVVPPRIGPVTYSWKIDLPPGTHTVAVQAQTTNNSRGMSPWVELNCGGQDPGPPSLYVLAIGINAYEGSMKLTYAAPDAEIIAKTLKERSTKLFSRIETKIVVDKDATKQEIMASLKWLASVMTPRDTAVVSFSGHGGCDRTGKQFLIPVDVNQRSPWTSSIEGAQFKNALGELPGRVILILDACHSGAVALSGGNAKMRAMMEDLIRDLISDDYGVIVLCSSLGSEVSLESAAVKQGFFTAGIVEGLAGKADFNGDGLIYLNELEGYAARRVKELSRDTQHPIFAKPTHVKWFPLATTAAKK